MSKAVQLITTLLEYINNEDTILNGNMYSKIRESTLCNKRLCRELVEASIDWALSNGLTMGSSTIKDACVHAPHTLLPVLVNLKQYQKLSSISLIFHKLIDALSRDSNFLISCIKETAESDANFTGKMLNLYKKQMSQNGFNQKYQLGIFRSDYMRNGHGLMRNWGQIEFNTIAASFGALSDLVFELHEYMLSRYLDLNNIETYNDSDDDNNNNNNNTRIYRPRASTTDAIAFALKTAALLVHDHNNATVLVLVQKGEKNAIDQRKIEYLLWNNYKIKCIRRTMFEVYANGALDPKTNELMIDGRHRISVVYYRCGYTPKDYGNEGYEWKAREIMEFSTAIKCPSIGYHLIGSKHFQTIFCEKAFLLRYVNEEEADELLSVFVKLYALHRNNDNNINEIVNKAKEKNKDWVLKPQREGGGNNYYNEDIPKMLNKLSPTELEGYVLMQRIYPEEIDTIEIRNFNSVYNKAICELGIYSTYLSNGIEEAMIDKVCGTLLRTKQAQVTEGGVATGYAVLDSLLLSNDAT